MRHTIMIDMDLRGGMFCKYAESIVSICDRESGGPAGE